MNKATLNSFRLEARNWAIVNYVLAAYILVICLNAIQLGTLHNIIGWTLVVLLYSFAALGIYCHLNARRYAKKMLTA